VKESQPLTEGRASCRAGSNGPLYTAARIPNSWIQVLLEFQRDWTRHATYEAARAIVVANGGGYGMGLAYAREMIHPA
jgi:hypothetical protein